MGAIYSTALSPSPIIVTGQTHGDGYPIISNDISMAIHNDSAKDKMTGYMAPSGIEFEWEGDRRDGQGRAGATLVIDQLGSTEGEGGLMEKVDVLAEIPFFIRKGLAAVTGTKPYIFQVSSIIRLVVRTETLQYLNPSVLEVKLGDETLPVKGWLFNEASFVSE